MTKIITKKIQGVEVNGVFCELEKDILCENIPNFQKIVRKIKDNNRFTLKNFKPIIEKAGELRCE